MGRRSCGRTCVSALTHAVSPPNGDPGCSWPSGQMRDRDELPGRAVLDGQIIGPLDRAVRDVQILHRPPHCRLFIHDSAAFDGVDGRLVGRCLAAGARLAEQHGLQHIVTVNSDGLESAEKETGLDFGPHVPPVRLSDAGESGGLFGFRF